MSDLTTAARPYAKAVYESAKAASSEHAWSEALTLLAAIATHEEMTLVLTTPHMSAADKGQLIIDIAADALNEQQKNLIRLLAENGRLSLLPEISALYEQLKAEAESKVEATVTSAYPLSDPQIQSLTEALKKKLGCDVEVVTEVDSTLLGGVVIKAGDLVIDGSAQARLNSLALALSH